MKASSLYLRHKPDEGAKKFLESDSKARPAANLIQRRSHLERIIGVQVRESRISREIERLVWSRKEIGWRRTT
jgi:hypothetical protein